MEQSSLSTPESCLTCVAFQERFAQEVETVVTLIKAELKPHIPYFPFRYSGRLQRQAPLVNGGDPKPYDEHRFHAKLRDGNSLVLEISSAYTYHNGKAVAPVRYFEQSGDTCLHYAEGHLVEWSQYMHKFRSSYLNRLERRRLDRAE